MQIREYKSSDLGTCLGLFDSNVPDFFEISERAAFEEFLKDPGTYYVLVLDSNEILACGGWYLDGEVAGLTWGIVHREHQQRGFGKFLLEERLKTIRSTRRANRVRVRTTSVVQGFFERAGFKTSCARIAGVTEKVPLVELILEL